MTVIVFSKGTSIIISIIPKGYQLIFFERHTIMLFAPKEKGQGLVEYALILVLVAVVVITVLLVLGPVIGNIFTKINSRLFNL